MIRGGVAVLAGFVVFSVALIAMEALTGSVDAFGTRGMTLWVTWEVIGMAVAGFTIASIAQQAPVGYAVVMGLMQTLLTLWAFFTVREQSSPAWFWISAMVLMTPSAWCGAWLQRVRPKAG
jgi:hypothetical protein